MFDSQQQANVRYCVVFFMTKHIMLRNLFLVFTYSLIKNHALVSLNIL